MKKIILAIAIFANISLSSCATTTLITTSTNKDGSTKEYRLQENSINYQGSTVSASTKTKVKSSSKPETIKYESFPITLNPVTTTTTTVENRGNGFGVLEGYAGAGLPAPVTFVRPEGSLPILHERFGFQEFPLYSANGAPNCGCVARGSCIGGVGVYTSQVLKFSDIVCGHQFETCCFDGPWAGTYDVFASAAACLPKEECRRPYGVLPTDVRDFGTIPPCPGLGAVRCILVDNAGFMEFQGALAAIEAANNYNVHHTVETTKFEPIHLSIPIVSSGDLELESTSSIEIEASKNPTPEVAKIVQPPCPPEVEHQKTIVIVTPPVQPVQPIKTTIITTPPLVPEVEKVVPEVPVTTVPAPHYYGTYGAYPSIIGAYPGFGYGAGFGFRKRIRFSKGFGAYGFGR